MALTDCDRFYTLQSEPPGTSSRFWVTVNFEWLVIGRGQGWGTQDACRENICDLVSFFRWKIYGFKICLGFFVDILSDFSDRYA